MSGQKTSPDTAQKPSLRLARNTDRQGREIKLHHDRARRQDVAAQFNVGERVLLPDGHQAKILRILPYGNIEVAYGKRRVQVFNARAIKKIGEG